MKFEAVIGLEVHSQLKTKTKLFSSSNNEFGEDPNANVSVVDLGLPGALPVINDKAVDLAILAGLSTDCKINKKSTFARKHYFYPDLPKGYQISQYDEQLASDGVIIIPDIQGIDKKIRINRIHMEEDAGKLIHDISDSYSMVDLNRAGVPLIEIVSEPDISSADEAVSYLKKLRSILIYANVSDCNMEEGNFRCDANISIRQVGEKELGVKAEIKNINSFKFVKKAIEYEIERQSKILGKGDKVVQETRLFNSNLNKTFSMRSKEDAHDYRYFPDPDLLPLEFSNDYVESIKKEIPELPDQKKSRFIEKFNLSPYEANILVSDLDTSKYFEAVTENSDVKLSSNWITGELFALLNEKNLEITESPISSKNLAKLINLIKKGTISGKIAKTIFELMSDGDKDPEKIVEEKGLKQQSDPKELEKIIDKIISENPKNVELYKSGKDKLFGFFVGQVMKSSGGKANPQLVNEILKKKLN